MKEGTGTDPFAEDSDESAGGERPDGRETATTATDNGSDTVGRTASDRDRTLPYIHARDGVMEDRNQEPVFLREETSAGLDELLDAVEADLGEEVYLSDLKEAAIEVAIEHPELVAEMMRDERYGYDWV